MFTWKCSLSILHRVNRLAKCTGINVFKYNDLYKHLHANIYPRLLFFCSHLSKPPFTPWADGAPLQWLHCDWSDSYIHLSDPTCFSKSAPWRFLLDPESQRNPELHPRSTQTGVSLSTAFLQCESNGTRRQRGVRLCLPAHDDKDGTGELYSQ